MEKESNINHGLKWGVIIGVIYCLFLFVRYSFGGDSPVLFGVWTFIGYLIVLILLLISGFQRRKSMGGYIELKDAFQTLFVSVIVFELFYAIFNFIYLKYINPDFFQNMKDSLEAFMEKNNVAQDQIDQALENIDKQAEKNVSLGNSVTSFAFSILISGVFALIMALIIKRKRPVFDSEQDRFVQNT